jgi:hypothetical protein
LPTIDEIVASVDDVAANPAAIEGDMGKVQEHSLKDLIEYERYRKNVNAISENGGRNIFKKIVPSGGTGVG